MPPRNGASVSIPPPVPRPPLASEEEPGAAVWRRRSPAAQAVLHTVPHTLRSEPPPADLSPTSPPVDPVSPTDRSTDASDASDAPYDDDDAPLPPLPVLTEDVPSALLLQTADSDESQDQLYQPALAVPAVPPAGTAEAEAEAADPVPSLDALDFVRTAERRAFWGRSWVVGALALLALTLAAALAAQVAVQHRDRLAASLPGLAPWLSTLCRPLRCSVAPLRQIDAVVIDGSSFNRTRAELYQLSIDVRNTASLPIAMPALELTLTDADDQPVLRRVLQPGEVRAPAVLPVRGAWSGTLPVRLDESGGTVRIAGYRLLAFYP